MGSSKQLRKNIVDILKDTSGKKDLLVSETAGIVEALQELCLGSKLDEDGKEVFMGALLATHRIVKWLQEPQPHMENSAALLEKAANSHLRLFSLIGDVCAQTRKKWFNAYEELISCRLERNEAAAAFELCVMQIQNCLSLDVNPVLTSSECKRLKKLHEEAKECIQIEENVFGCLAALFRRVLQTKSDGQEVKQRLEEMLSELSSILLYFARHCSIEDKVLEKTSSLYTEPVPVFLSQKTTEILGETLSIALKNEGAPQAADHLLEISLSGPLGARAVMACFSGLSPETSAGLLARLDAAKIPRNILEQLSKSVCPSLRLTKHSNIQCSAHATRNRCTALYLLGTPPQAPHMVLIQNKAPLLQKQDVSSLLLLALVNSDMKILLTRAISKINQLAVLIRQKRASKECIASACSIP